MPESCSDEDLSKADQKTKDSYKQNFDRKHGAVPLTPLKPGDPVPVKTDEDSAWKKEGTVVAVDPGDRTYLVSSPAGGLCRSRKHLQKLPSPRLVVTVDPSNGSSSTTDSQDANDLKDIDSKDVADPQGTAPPSAPPTATRNTRAAIGYMEEEEIRTH